MMNCPARPPTYRSDPVRASTPERASGRRETRGCTPGPQRKLPGRPALALLQGSTAIPASHVLSPENPSYRFFHP